MTDRKRTAAVLAALVCLSLAAGPSGPAWGSQAARQPDPFYLSLLLSGEQAYRAQSFREAIQSFEVAVFGLSQDKALLGKTLGYLVLCHFNLKDDIRAKDHLLRLIDLVGLAGIAGLALEEQERLYLAQLAAFYKLDAPPSGQAGPARTDLLGSSRPAGPGQKPAAPADQLKGLKEKVKAEPENRQAYLDLYDFELQQKNRKGARRALLDMMRRIPADPAAPFLLGKLRYVDKDFKEASGYLEKTLELKKDAPASDKDYAEAQAYLILCYNSLAQKPLLESAPRSFLARSAPESVLSFDLTDKDKNLVLSILDRFGKEAPAAAPPAATEPPPAPAAAPEGAPVRDAQSIQREIKKNPGDASLYYGLYDLYRQKKDRSSARQTLQRLVRNNPLEAKAYLLLGKLHYEDKDYEDASDTLIRIFSLPAAASADETLKSEAAFYLALSSYLDKDKARSLEVFNLYLPLIQRFMGSGSPITDSDSVAWQNLRLMAEAAPQVYLLAVRPEKTETSLAVEIELSKPTSYRTYILTADKSIVIELYQMAGIKAPGLVPVNARGVKSVRSMLLPKGVVRVVLEGQLQIPSHRIVRTESGLSVIID